MLVLIERERDKAISMFILEMSKKTKFRGGLLGFLAGHFSNNFDQILHTHIKFTTE